MNNMPPVKRIAVNNMPIFYPIHSAVISFLVLDKFQAPGWLWGVVITLWVVAFASVLVVQRNSTSVDLFAEDKDKTS